MLVQKDYEELLKLFNKNKVRYCAGCSFKKAWEDKVVGRYGRQKVFFIGKSDLIKTKLTSGRRQDKMDADILSKEIK